MQALWETDPRRIGPYEVLGRLGAGGMGEVYLAESRTGLRLAVKVVRAEHAEDRTFRARFRHEVRAAQTVGGAGTYTARVVDADTDAEQPWMATEFVDGPNLRDAVLDGGPLPEDAVLLLAAALGEALAAIHSKGMVHRDLKPSNILLAPDGPRVIDFGIVRALEATALTRTGTVVGSVGYVSPEQIRNGGQVGAPSDVFSLGVVLAYAAAGREPFGEGKDAVILMRILTRDVDLSGVPEGIRPLVESCLQEEAGKRPTPAEVVEAVGHTARSLRERVRPGWYTAADPDPDATESWLPARDSGERESRVEYVAPVTVTDVSAGGTTTTAERPSRRGLLKVVAGGAVVAAGAVGGWLWWDRDDAGGGAADGGGAAGSGSVGSGSPSASAATDVARATVRWTYRTESSSVLADSVALSADGRVVYVAGGGELHAVGVDGRRRWRVGLGAPDVARPVVTAEGVYCAVSDGYGNDCRLVAVNLDGSRRWTKDLPVRQLDGEPAAGGGLVLVGYGELGAGGVRAYTPSGELRWERQMQGAPDVSPVVFGSVAYVGSYDNSLHALDVTDGSARWRHELDSDVARPVVAGDTIVVSTNNQDDYPLYGISTAGKRLWRADGAGGGVYSTVAVADGSVFATAGETLVATGLDGRRRWSYRPANGASPTPTASEELGDFPDFVQVSEPVVADGVVYVSSEGTIHAVGTDGKQRWTLATGGSTEGLSPLVVRGKQLYAVTEDGVVAVDVTS